MRFDVVFFDFDGTLVQSARAKHEAFFAIFPDTARHRSIIVEVLRADPDGSRYTVVPRMVEAMQEQGLELPSGHTAEERIAAYGEAAFAAVARSPETPGAVRLLEGLAGRAYRVVMSVTPQPVLEKLIRRRGWRRLVEEVHGHPAAKPKIIAKVLARLGKAPDCAVVIGDGIGDEEAARLTGCYFFRVVAPNDIETIASSLGIETVQN